MTTKPETDYSNFSHLDIRVGTVIKAQEFPEAKIPAYQCWIDFGEFGIKKTSAQITQNYSPKTLLNQKVVAIINFPKKQIGKFMSECLILGIEDQTGVILLKPDNLNNSSQIKNGAQIY